MTFPHNELAGYQGFEQGPIRPPSEAYSLLIRVTRNCPWNRCTFCTIYKTTQFSLRPVAHVIEDIDRVHRYLSGFFKNADASQPITRERAVAVADDIIPKDTMAFQAAYHWASTGMQSIFLQDANSLIIKPEALIHILRHLKKRFPWVERITSYARSRTIARIHDDDLGAMREAGLNRIHIGLESGADAVLKMISKGVDQATHIKAGLKVKKAGMELSEYVMPGLGGKALSTEHAMETAYTLNQINPDFIRLRSLTVPNQSCLYQVLAAGDFQKCTEIETAGEILLFLEHLNGITSTVKSDHVLNLFQEIEGTLPGDKPAMTGVIKTFLALPPADQCIYIVGRRMGILSQLSDMQRPHRYQKVQDTCTRLGITAENVDRFIDEMTKRFV
ncbi:MAG: radical SAM protein [Desulfobacterales bacterium]|nr:radical SAM protein [Desulfobacterales bacterium]